MIRIARCAVLMLLLAPATARSQTSISFVEGLGQTRFSSELLVGDDLYAWAAQQLHHFDVSNPASPATVSVVGIADPSYFERSPIPLENNLFYVEVGGQTHLYDFTDSANPSDLGPISPQLGSCAYVSHEDLYDAATQTLHHVCNPETPMLVQAWDLSSPLAPVLLWESNIPIPLNCYSAQLSMRGDYGYATWTSFEHDPYTGDSTWFIHFGRFDYSVPTAPTLLGSNVLYSGASAPDADTWISGDTLFVLIGDTLRSYSFGAAGAVTLLDTLVLSSATRGNQQQGDDLLLWGGGKLFLVDTTAPSSLSLLCEQQVASAPDWITAAVSNGTELFAARYSKGLYVYDFDCAGPFTELAAKETFVDPQLSVVVGDHAFARAYESLWAIGLDASGHIELQDHVPADKYGLIFGLDSGYVLQRIGNSLAVFDVQDPTAIQPLAAAPMGFSTYALESRGSLAAVRGSYNGHQGLYLFDFANPSAPQQLGVADLGVSYYDINKYTTMAFTEDAVYLAYDQYILVVDIADQANPALVQAILTPPAVTTRMLLDVCLGSLITSKYDSHQVWSLADPLNPTAVGSLAIPMNDHYRCLNIGSLLLAVGTSIAAFDFSDPTAPLFLTDLDIAAGEFDVLQVGSAIMTMYAGSGYASYLVDSTVPAPVSSTVRALLGQNQPNPFGADTVIRLRAPVEGAYRMQIFDVAGRLVREWRGANAPMEFRWDGRDRSGRPVSSGVYYYEFMGAGHTESRRMVLRR